MGDGLAERLRNEIGERGPITFARFMEAALYDPGEGFYASPPIGAEGHFLTSPHVSPLFGRLLALQAAEAFDLLGQPDPFHLVEFGAGDGTLAREILHAAEGAPAFARALRYVAVERSPGARRALRDTGIAALADDGALPEAVTGLVLANELLDNLPFHLVRREDGRLLELFVDAEGDELVLVPGELSDERLAELAASLPEGAEGAVSPAAEVWLQRAAAVLDHGYIVVIDYGGSGPRPPMTYRSQRSGQELLRDPGSADLTAGVDFDALAAAARGMGLEVWGPVTQREALLALGFGRIAEADRAETAAARDAGDHLAAARRWAARSRDSLLVDPAALGGLQVIVFGVRARKPLACVAAATAGAGPRG